VAYFVRVDCQRSAQVAKAVGITNGVLEKARHGDRLGPLGTGAGFAPST